MCNGSTTTPGKPRIIDNAGNGALPIGIESFEEIVDRFVYVDKTLLLQDLVDKGGTTLFCRPRRFGKSLTMRMLQCFFETPVAGYVNDRRGLFENLAIWDTGDRYRAEQGAHPVIYLTLGSVHGATWEDSRALIADLIGAEYQRHAYLLEGDARAVGLDRERFVRLAKSEGSDAELTSSLTRLARYLSRHHGSGTVILIDEYARPITEGHLSGYRDEATRFMRSWLTDALKGTVDLYLACLTGVQRVSKESIFSDLNNIKIDTPLDHAHAESFGFTEPEAEALAAYLGRDANIDEMRAWYDGYSFGGTRVYNPISTLEYLQSGIAQPYWVNTSANAVVTRMFQKADVLTDARLQTLAKGDEIQEALDLQVVFGEIDSDTGAIWSQLYLAGYLTTDDVQRPRDATLARHLRVPNFEVRELFGREFLDRANKLAVGGRLQALCGSLVIGDTERFGQALGRIVEESASFRDLTSEAACHMLLMGMLYEVPGYKYPTSNRETGLGCSDILIEPMAESASRLPAIAIEVKRARTATGGDVTDPAELAAHARDVALQQAIDRHYGTGLAGNGRMLWGVSFSGKRVACAMRRIDAGA